MRITVKPVRIPGDISIWTLQQVANSSYCAKDDNWLFEIIKVLKGRRVPFHL
jgi:hypothetical protein